MFIDESGLASGGDLQRGAKAPSAEQVRASILPVRKRPGISPAGLAAVRDSAARRRRAGRRVLSGFRPRSELFHRVYNMALAGGLFVLALPVTGLIALLVRLFSGAERSEITAFDANAFLEKIGVTGALSAQRSNGLASMLARIKQTAAAA